MKHCIAEFDGAFMSADRVVPDSEMTVRSLPHTSSTSLRRANKE